MATAQPKTLRSRRQRVAILARTERRMSGTLGMKKPENSRVSKPTYLFAISLLRLLLPDPLLDPGASLVPRDILQQPKKT
jgi:hypothetical protein